MRESKSPIRAVFITTIYAALFALFALFVANNADPYWASTIMLYITLNSILVVWLLILFVVCSRNPRLKKAPWCTRDCRKSMLSTTILDIIYTGVLVALLYVPSADLLSPFPRFILFVTFSLFGAVGFIYGDAIILTVQLIKTTRKEV